MQDHCKYHPKASRFQDARRKLDTVSECTSGSPRKQDLESGFNQDDVQPECPICIGPLFVPNNKNAAGAEPMQAMPSQTPGGSAGIGGQAGPSQHMAAGDASDTRNPASKWGISVGRLWGKRPVETSMKPSDDDVLTLKGCQHAFHANCLSLWFLIDRYDCPVCRNPYWQSREEKARAALAPPGPESDGGDNGPGIARPALARLNSSARPAMPVL
ncbi:hypothetical protein LZ32DRAFT_602743 [Colletotrichum eremochloae]|nr:hypothetical protein LZ32DRAFT_602743 [Colletotrichum eremochloae]